MCIVKRYIENIMIVFNIFLGAGSIHSLHSLLSLTNFSPKMGLPHFQRKHLIYVFDVVINANVVFHKKIKMFLSNILNTIFFLKTLLILKSD